MVVFGSKSSSTKTKLFEQPLDKLFNPKAIKHFNETIAASNSRSPPALCQSLSAPLTSSTLTWAKLSQENSATKRKRAAARLRRFTIDANNNTSGLITSLASAPIISPAAAPLCISHRLEASPQCTTTSPSNLSTTSNSNTNDSNHHETTTSSEGQLNEDERCRLLLNVLPEPIRCLLNEIYLRGPSTVGIFRKSPNAKHCKELKQKLESPDFHLSAIEQFQVNVIASVFKEWLRSLPDCLLMSRLYPQWIDVAKLIEPLHLHYQKQQQQQLQQQQQSNDHALDTRLGSTSAFEGNLNGNLTKSSNGSGDCKPPTSLRPTQPATSPLTDNGQKQQKQLQQQAGNLTTATTDAVVHGQQQLSRALSCSIMASDSGHSSTSSSPSSSSSSFDSCEVVAGARAGKHFQKATSEIHQQSSAQVAASYLKRKCYQQRQQSQSSIDYDSTRNIGSLISVDGCMSDMANSQSGNFHSNNNNMSMSMSEFSIRERRFECIRVVRQLLEALNETNLILLRAIICVLWNIADNHNYNKMSSNNLGVCIGQSLLNDEQQQHYLQSRGKKLQSFTLSLSSSSQLAHHQTNDAPKHASTSNNFTKRHRRARSQCLLASTLSLTNLSHLSTNSSPTNSTASNGQLTNSISSNYLDSSGAQEAAKYVPILVAFMIDNAKELFGSDVMYLFGPDRPLKQSDQENNETTLSDSQSQQPVTTTTTTGSSQASLVEAEICANIGEQVAVVVGANITTPTTKVRTKDQLVHIGGCGGSNGDELAHDDHHSLECKSIVVTREQNEPLGRRSDLFVKMDAQQPSEHLISSKQLTTAPSSCISQVKQHRRHMSTSVLVHIGSQPFTTSDHVTGAPSESSDAKGRVQLHANNDNATKLATSPETTSILIVNTPKKQQTDQLLLSPESAFELDHNHRCASSSYDDDAKEYSSSSRSSSISNDLQLKLRQQQTSDSQSSGSADSVDHHHRRCPDSSSPSSLIGVDDRVNDTTSDQEHKATTTGAAVTTTTMTDTTTIADSTTQQQRPLSVTESTTSSSRASSSTSGVHSESPAFSCEQDSASSSSSSTTSSSHHNCGTRSATTCSTSSRSASISSPTSSALSSCTSPTDMDMGTDVIDGDHHHHQHNHNHERHMGIDVTTLSHNEAMRHNLIGQVRLDPAPKLPSQVTSAGISLREPRVSMSGGLVESRTSLERPRSMVSLGKQADIMSRDNNMDQAGATIVRYQNINNNNNGNSISHDRQYSSALNANNDKENQFIMNQRQHRSQFQSQTLNRYSSASSQLVNLNRMPKIPFQYTTSCYGGEAVLYYPTNAHLSHHQSMRHQQDQQQQQQQAMLRQQQQGGPFPSATMQLRGCNRIQSLDRHTQLHHSSGQLHQQQQQQQPQRSHVMMLRDYYLSLQEQSQKQQQYQEFLKRQHQQSKQQMLVSCQNQKTAVTNSTTIGDHLQAIQQQHPQQQYHRQSHLMMMQPPVESRRILSSHQAQQQQQQLQHHHHQQQQQKQQCSSVTTNLNAMQADGATNASRNNDHELMREQQPASATAAAAAVAYQCIQPRLARIPPNQFNGLYVKRATSPMRSHEINGNDLMVLDHRHQAASGCGGGGGSIVVKPIASSGAAGSNLMAISQSSLSQQSSKMSSSSSTAEHSSDEEVCSSDECSTSEWMESTMV